MIILENVNKNGVALTCYMCTHFEPSIKLCTLLRNVINNPNIARVCDKASTNCLFCTECHEERDIAGENADGNAGAPKLICAATGDPITDVNQVCRKKIVSSS